MRIMDHVLVRLAVYYAGVLAVIYVLFLFVPSLGESWIAERARGVGANPGIQPGTPEEFQAWRDTVMDSLRIVPVVLSMMGALALCLPIAWVYTWTDSTRDRATGLPQALLVLPVTIALVVYLVKGSLALAFSLAGIMAAVRFRTLLSDVLDSGFLIMAIGIGLAAGVQLLGVAFVASVFFTLTMLIIHHRGDFGAPVRVENWRIVRPVDD